MTLYNPNTWIKGYFPYLLLNPKKLRIIRETTKKIDPFFITILPENSRYLERRYICPEKHSDNLILTLQECFDRQLDYGDEEFNKEIKERVIVDIRSLLTQDFSLNTKTRYRSSLIRVLLAYSIPNSIKIEEEMHEGFNFFMKYADEIAKTYPLFDERTIDGNWKSLFPLWG